MYNPRFKWRREEVPPEDEVGPDFAGIAARLDEMARLERAGWWGDTGFQPEQEEVMRTVAHVVGRVAEDMAANREPEGSMAAQLMEEVHHFLHWYQNVAVNDDADFRRRVEHVRHEVGTLSCEMEAHFAAHRASAPSNEGESDAR